MRYISKISAHSLINNKSVNILVQHTDTKEKKTLSRNRAAKAQAKRMNQVVENTIAFNQQAPKAANRRIDLIPRTRNQEALVMALQNPDAHIVVTAGPAGTGKTYLAMQAAIKALKEGACDRIVMTRPAVGVEGEQHGFLPGNLVAKMEPWTRPLLDVMREYYRPQDIVAMIEDQVVEIAPLAFMRGRTFKNAWIIADEMQNATPAQCKMLMTRIGSNSKIVITGDVEQADRQHGENGLMDLCERLQKGGVNGIAVCSLEGRDVQRHKIIGPVLKLYQ
jgi:phosphate starvation-inducible PhoH-like protein